MKIRPSTLNDAKGISLVLQQLVEAEKRSARSDQDFVLSNYLDNPMGLQCTVAEDTDDTILGFQALLLAAEDNAYGVKAGWGIIGTHVSPLAARRGIGKALFAETLLVAKTAGLTKLDATIGKDNAEGLAYYESVGFSTYKTTDGKISKCYSVE